MIRSVMMLIFFIVISYAPGAVGGYVTAMTVRTWYLTLKLPAIAPPGWFIGIVWNILYAMIAAAGFIAWRSGSSPRPMLLWSMFVLQLVLNLLWSLLFFGLKSPGAALIEIIALWLAIVATMLLLWQANRWAGALFIPYAAWVAFASVLNAMIWRMNV